MKVCLIQMDVVWHAPEENRLRAAELMEQQPGADLYVLPEMFSTGFVMNPEVMAEPAVGGETLAWMKCMADKLNAVVAGSVSVEEDGKYYNRFYFVKPGGEVTFADKRHLFAYGGEDHCYTAGTSRVVVEWCNVRILLLVCYDLRFPVWSRSRDDFDMMIYVANWPAAREGAWDTLLRARSIENQCYVVGVNRVGTDPVCEYTGGSVLVDAYGRTVAGCDKGKEQAVCAIPDMIRLHTFRRKFPVLKDADDFLLTGL